MNYSIEEITSSSQNEMLAFLKCHEDYSLFLLNNFENYGAHLTNAPYSGNFKQIRFGKEVIAVFCLTRSGSLLVETKIKEPIFDIILDACRKEPLPIKGLIGNWDFCEHFWKYLKKQRIIEQELFASKEILYSINVRNWKFPSQKNVKLLAIQDYEQWKHLRESYLLAEGIPNDLSENQILNLFLDAVNKKILWGYFVDNTLVSMADLNAKALDLGQVGGVYTNPLFRRRGYSKAVMMQVIHDAKELHSIRKLIIFTGEKNFAAQNLYLSLGVSQTGYFSLLFGNQLNPLLA